MMIHILVIALRVMIAVLVGTSLWFLVQAWHNGKGE